MKLHVTDIIKGDAEKILDFVIENGGKIGQWQAESVPIVVFLRDRKLPIQNEKGLPLIATRGDEKSIPLRYAGRGPDVKTILAFDVVDHPSQFSANLSWTNDPQEMLQIVGEYLARVSAAGELESVNNRSMYVRRVENALKDTHWEAKEHVGFTFPINEYLKDHAQRWVQSPDKLHRWLGAYALAFFESEQNAEILQDLLDDSGQWELPVHVSSYTHQRVTYLVRWEAWKILTAWGYDVPAPEFGKQ